MSRPGAFVEPVAGPIAGTGYTLNQIMAKMPAVDATNGAAVADVLANKTFWGLINGAWGLKTGSATAGANVTGSNGSLSMTIPDALYSGSKTATAADTNLSVGNIKSGVTVFGTTGTFTNDGDAVAGDLVLNKKAYVNGLLVTGSLNATAGANVTGTNGSLSMTIPNALYSGGKTATAADTNLVAGNIKNTVQIFGVTGNYTGGGGSSTAPVPKTGQTPTLPLLDPLPPGSDGALQKGVALPSPRFTCNPSGDCATSNGTVTDNLTGLIWLKNANCANATRVWATALTDVASLNSAGTMNTNSCGDTSNAGNHQTDWRLPNARELYSLINLAYSVPALTTGHPFTGVRSSIYWSSTGDAYESSRAWSVGLFNGDVSLNDEANDYYVWPVRGGL
ncbi:MAG: DUF1566 domain-containing protein [Candidatus Contendobacter sp.]|nr:DUF1566 domain-containing protein [Candidatus Contendobacter sp.]